MGPVLEDWNVERSPWLEEIRREGELRARRTAVTIVLEVRFPGAVPPDVIEAIGRETNLHLLRQCLPLAAVKSLEEVRAFLQQVAK